MVPSLPACPLSSNTAWLAAQDLRLRASSWLGEGSFCPHGPFSPLPELLPWFKILVTTWVFSPLGIPPRSSILTFSFRHLQVKSFPPYASAPLWVLL